MKNPLLSTLTLAVKFAVLPGGKLPTKHPDRPGDAGLDCYVRAVVDPTKSSEPGNIRKTVNDFSTDRIYRLSPGNSVSLGLGFNVEIPFGMAGFIYPRGSSVINKESPHIRHLQVLNTNPIDHGFTGEPWVELRNEGCNTIYIHLHDKLVQLVIVPVWCGRIVEVSKICGGARGNGSNGSTGS